MNDEDKDAGTEEAERAWAEVRAKIVEIARLRCLSLAYEQLSRHADRIRNLPLTDDAEGT